MRPPAVEVVMVVKVAGDPSPCECDPDGNMAAAGQLAAIGRPMVGSLPSAAATCTRSACIAAANWPRSCACDGKG